MKGEILELNVSHIGAQGDGIAATKEGAVYIPGAAPKERMRARITGKIADGWAGEIVEILTPGPNRLTPPCPHFGTCGGCRLQHLDAQTIAEQKRRILIEAMSRKGLEGLPVTKTLTIPPATRRRARFAVRRLGKKAAILGFNERAESNVVDIQECGVLLPALAAYLPKLRALALALPSLGKAADFQTLWSETGLDLLIVPDGGTEPGRKEREHLVTFAQSADVARISWQAGPDGEIEPIAARRPVRARFSGLTVDLPPGAFLQPSLEGEKLLAALIDTQVSEASRVADLYAGCGSFSLPMAAKGALVHAVDGSDSQVDALRKTAGAAQLRLTAEARDLIRNPLTSKELARYDTVVFDPPRAGAAPQSEALARSEVSKVVAVSCNPATMARDLRILVDGGYRIDKLMPVDQFTWSAHLEAMAFLTRP